MRVDKRYRGKPLPKGDLDQIAKFRAEMEIYDRLRREGLTHEQAMARVFAGGD